MSQPIQNGILNATTATFEVVVLSSQTPVVVDFWAPWCPHCKKLDTSFGELASSMGSELKFVKVNVDEEPNLARQYGVSSLPTLKFFCGGREIGKTIGGLPKPQLEAAMRQTLSGHEECIASSSPMKK